MFTLWMLMLSAAVIYFFWQNRKIAESAWQHAENQAKQLNVQLLSIACTKRRIGVLKNGKPGIKSQFLFEFSSDGETKYQGELEFEDIKLVKSTIPPYRM